MGKRVYIETSVISYLVARPSGSILAAAWQRVTHDWWENEKSRFELFTSELVWAEAGQGDAGAAQARCERLRDIPDLQVTDAVVALAKDLVRWGALPKEAMDDAMHVAIAAVHDIDYLLTWNYRHLDNAEKKPLMRSVCTIAGYRCPEICTPQELMGDQADD
jgi:predicted nucleic acid-binding protein